MRVTPLLAVLLVCTIVQAADTPNVIVIFTDDQGYADVGCFGARGFETPNLDRLAAQGARLTSFYTAQPVCSASRAALLTGCYPNRIGISGALGPNARHGINADETTLAELCRDQGYATAVFGKWHLGHRPPFLPTRHGFDEYAGLPYSNDMWPLHPAYIDLPADAAARKRGYPDLAFYENETIIVPEVTPADQRWLTRDVTDRAVDFIERHASRPFFLYLAHSMPHVPLFTAPEFQGRSRQGLYGDVIEEIDWSVGRVIETLERLDLDRSTLVLFTSDNGPWLSYGTHAGATGPLREGKGTTWEGGVRVPFIAWWPGRIRGGHVTDEPAMTIDILPTVTRLVGADLPATRIDGLDIWPLLSGEPNARSPHDAFYFYYHGNDLEAVRSGRWKLVFPHRYRSLTKPPGQGGRPAGYTHPTCGLELYDLSSDIGETTNVADAHPDVVARLVALAERARDDLGDGLTEREGVGRRAAGRID